MTHPTVDDMRAMFGSDDIAAKLESSNGALDLYSDVAALCFRYMEKGRLNKAEMVKLLTMARLAMWEAYRFANIREAEQRFTAARMEGKKQVLDQINAGRCDQDALLELREVAPFGDSLSAIPEWLRDPFATGEENNGAE